MQLKLRYADFRTITRSHTLPTPTDLAAEIARRRARRSSRAVDLGDGIRLLGRVGAAARGRASRSRTRLDLDAEPDAEDRRAPTTRSARCGARFGATRSASAAFVERGASAPGRRASLWATTVRPSRRQEGDDAADRARRLRAHRHRALVRAAPAHRRRPRRRATSPRPTTPTPSGPARLAEHHDAEPRATLGRARSTRSTSRGSAPGPPATSRRSRPPSPRGLAGLLREAARADARGLPSSIAALLEQVPHQVGLVLRHAPVFAHASPRSSHRAATAGRWRSILRDDQYFPIQGMYGSTWRSDVAKAGRRHAHRALDPRPRRDALDPRRPADVGRAARRPRSSAMRASTTWPRSRSVCRVARPRTLVSVWHQVLTRPSTRRLEVFCEDAFLWTEDDYLGPLHVETTDGRRGDRGRSAARGSTASRSPRSTPSRWPSTPSRARRSSTPWSADGSRGPRRARTWQVALAAHRDRRRGLPVGRGGWRARTAVRRVSERPALRAGCRRDEDGRCRFPRKSNGSSRRSKPT